MTIREQVDFLITELDHFEQGLTHDLDGAIKSLWEWWNQQPAVSAYLQTGDTTMNTDTTTGTITVAFQDDKGNPVEPPANLGAIPFTSDNETVVTVAVDPANPLQAHISPVGVGQANVGVGQIVDAAGSTLLLPDGVTPFPVPAAVAVDVQPAPAAQAVVSVTE